MNIFIQKYYMTQILLQDDNLGILDLQSNLKINNYDTNKTSKIFINDFD